MLINTEKIPPPRRPQLFNDHAAIDAALAEQQDKHDHWIDILWTILPAPSEK